jgi:hypothetical protein
MARFPAAFGQLLCAVDLALDPGLEIAVAGIPDSPETAVLLGEVFSRYLPNKVVACGPEGSHPLLQGRAMAGDQPAAYVCRGRVCSRPVTTCSDVAALLTPDVLR